MRETPLVHSPALSEATGADVWLKCENLQVTGSFKVRGATNRLLTPARGGARVGAWWRLRPAITASRWRTPATR